MKPRLIHVALIAASLASASAGAQTSSGRSGSADPALLQQLANILGQAHAIRSMCNGDSDQTWRNYMVEFLEMEAGSGVPRSSLTSAFNAGHRAQTRQSNACRPEHIGIEKDLARRGRELSEMIALDYLE